MSRLKRSLGTISLTFYGVGLIIGAGIYSVIGAAAGTAGPTLWWSFIIGAVIALLTALSYAELATTYPEAGAEFIYLKRAFPRRRWAAFVIGCVMTSAGAATAATVSVAFAGYLTRFFHVPPLGAALALLLVGTAVNISGIKPSSAVNIIFTLIEITGLTIVIAAGMRAPGFGDALRVAPTAQTVVGAAIIFFVYLGFEEIANLSEEAVRPRSSLPRAIFISLVVTTVLYLLVSLAVVALVPPPQLAASSAPLATAVGANTRSGTLLSAIALFATANTALITLIVASRMLFSMARAGEIPEGVARILPGRKTPWIAAVIVFVIASCLLPLGKVKTLGSLSSLMSLIAFGSVHLSLIALRFRDPDRDRPFRVPLAIRRVPLLPLLGIVTAAALILHFELTVHAIGAGAIALILLLYWIAQVRPSMRKG